MLEVDAFKLAMTPAAHSMVRARAMKHTSKERIMLLASVIEKALKEVPGGVTQAEAILASDYFCCLSSSVVLEGWLN